MRRKPISWATGILMVTVAALIDFLQVCINIVPIIGWILGFILAPFISALAYMLFYGWFSIYGVRLLKGKNMLSTISTLLIEFLPGFDEILPGWTVYVFFTFLRNRHPSSEV